MAALNHMELACFLSSLLIFIYYYYNHKWKPTKFPLFTWLQSDWLDFLKNFNLNNLWADYCGGTTTTTTPP